MADPYFEYENLMPLKMTAVRERRQLVFLVLSGLFLGTLAMLNVLGVTRFIDLSFSFLGVDIPVILAVGVLPYPVTFLCTDFISELYGQKRANQVVWMGLVLNLWMVFILWLGGVLPGVSAEADAQSVFFPLRKLAFSAVGASMVAYLTAQFVDVHLFHFWKKRTRGRHLWLRNNASTLVSQLIDSVAVILITFWVGGLPMNESKPVVGQLMVFILSGYSFKVVSALVDTAPFYWGTKHLCRYLRLPPPDASFSDEKREDSVL